MSLTLPLTSAPKPNPSQIKSPYPMTTPLHTLLILLTLLSVAAATAVQPLLTPSSAAVTIPAFPEQSDTAGCRLSFPPSFFRGVKSACGNGGAEIHRGRCCPALAAWLYSAYSATALGPAQRRPAAAYDMPVLPDDSETCVGEAERAMRQRGVVLRRPNETCDVVYCYCGIRLRSLSCPAAFSSSAEGKLVGDASVTRLERDCLQRSDVPDGFPGLGGCSKCLHSLRLLNKKKALNTSKLEDMRTTKMRNKDCEMMGLTWLLAKNRTAYIRTVSAVIRAIMLSPDGADHHQSCALSSDGMPLAVDSSEISDQSESNGLVPLLQMSISTLVVSMLYMYIIWPFHN